MPTVQIPLTTLPPGVRDFGPVNLADADSNITLLIDRTPANGLNATPSAQIEMEVPVSLDGGITWVNAAAALVVGGQITHPRTGAIADTESSVGVLLNQFPGTGRKIKATLTVSGSSVAVSGTLTTS